MARRSIIALVSLVAVLAAGCDSGETVEEPLPTVGTAPTAGIPSGDPELEAMLIRRPDFGGDGWVVQTDGGGTIDSLDLVCGMELPSDRPRSERHAGRLFLGGEPYPVLLEAIDGYANAADAAAVVDLHRAAAVSCTSWVQPQEGDVDVEFTVRMLGIDVPAGGIAVEVAAPDHPTVAASQFVMFADGASLWFLGNISTEPDEALLAQLLTQAWGE